MNVCRANRDDLVNILELQKKAFVQEAELLNTYAIQPLQQKLQEINEEYEEKVFLKLVYEGNIVGSVRAFLCEGVCNIEKVIVSPNCQRMGIGSILLNAIENEFKNAQKFVLATAYKSKNNIRFYEKNGYSVIKKGKFHDGIDAVFMEKNNT